MQRQIKWLPGVWTRCRSRSCGELYDSERRLLNGLLDLKTGRRPRHRDRTRPSSLLFRRDLLRSTEGSAGEQPVNYPNSRTLIIHVPRRRASPLVVVDREEGLVRPRNLDESRRRRRLYLG